MEKQSELLVHQTTLAQFGERALRSDDLDEILTEACHLAGQALGTDLAKVMELQEDGKTLLVRAGVGWKPGIVGILTLHADENSSEGHALRTGEPMISPDIDKETRFEYPHFLVDHGVKAVANVLIIGGQGKPPYGILQVDSRSPRAFPPNDMAFLRSYANLLAAAVDRLHVLDAVREGEARLRLALEAGELGTWEFDVADGIARCSRRHDQIFGYAEPPKVWTLPIALEHILPEDREAVVASYQASIDNDVDWTFQCRIRRADTGATRWIEVHGRPSGARGNHPAQMMGIVADIDERKKLEEMLHHSNEVLEEIVAHRTRALTEANRLLQAEAEERGRVEEALRQSLKMEAVGQLTGGLAHDFNNLLTGMMGNLDLMRSHLARGKTSELDRYVNSTMAIVKRGAAVTHRLLAFARRQTLDPRPTDVNRLVRNMEELLQRSAGSTIKVRSILAEDAWPTLCDRNQLENALLNLVINARDAMPEGGRLKIETDNIIVGERQAMPGRTDLVRPGDYLTIAVADSGQGMSPEVIARAFEPFFTTKPVGEGSGLGLSMIYGFVQQSGGHVLLQAEAGSGTTVTIYLPRHIGDVLEDDVKAPAAVPQPSTSSATVLLVEDDEDVRAVISETLSNLGYRVLEAGDSPSGLLAVASPDPIDLLLSDVGLPGGMNGLQLADAARLQRPDLRVLFMTGYGDRADFANKNMKRGMQLITKPFALDALAMKVETMIATPPLAIASD